METKVLIADDHSIVRMGLGSLIKQLNVSVVDEVANCADLMAQLNTAPATFQLLIATTPAVTESGVLEFYVDCDGTVGWINIDNWSAT